MQAGKTRVWPFALKGLKGGASAALGRPDALTHPRHCYEQRTVTSRQTKRPTGFLLVGRGQLEVELRGARPTQVNAHAPSRFRSRGVI